MICALVYVASTTRLKYMLFEYVMFRVVGFKHLCFGIVKLFC